MEKKKIIIGTSVALILIGAACAGTVYYYLFALQFHPQRTVYIYIDRDDTADPYIIRNNKAIPEASPASAGWPNTRNIPKIYTLDATPSGRGKRISRIQPSVPRDIKNLRTSPSAAYAHWTGWHAA